MPDSLFSSKTINYDVSYFKGNVTCVFFHCYKYITIIHITVTSVYLSKLKKFLHYRKAIFFLRMLLPFIDQFLGITAYRGVARIFQSGGSHCVTPTLLTRLSCRHPCCVLLKVAFFFFFFFFFFG